MKNILLLTIGLLLGFVVLSQTPASFTYQAALRNADGSIIANQETTVIIEILSGTTDGPAIFTETHNTTTSSMGIVNLTVGSINDLGVVDWGTDNFFIKVTVDEVVLGTVQLLSVPYALHAKTAETITGTTTETDPIFTSWDKSTGISITESQISDLGTYIETENDPAVAANFDFTDATAGDLLQFNGTKWVKVTPDYISDYTVTESDVTAHQAALTVTESQISDLGTYIETETDPVFLAWDKSTGILITESQVSDLGSYLETEIDPAFTTNFDFTNAANGDLLQFNGSKWVKVTPTYISDYTVTQSDVTAHEAALTVTESQISDLGNYVETETDPTVPAHVKAITTDNILDWNEAHGWGNHSAEGYATKDMNSEKITNLADPTDAQDAATKAYVDLLLERIEFLEQINGVEEPVTDFDGNKYKTVRIGEQVWMAENLKTTHYANGEEIPDGTGAGDIAAATEPKYWFAYADDLNNVSTYGRLYTWYTVTDSRNVCPDGWHVPTDDEWTSLTTFLGGESIAGGKLKEIGTTHWTTPNTGATDEIRFTALPGGWRNPNGPSYLVGDFCYWWSITEAGPSDALMRSLSAVNSSVYRGTEHRKSGLSVRCLRD